jgi:hypothetical protein
MRLLSKKWKYLHFVFTFTFQLSKFSQNNSIYERNPSIILRANKLGVFLTLLETKIRRTADDYDKQTFATFHPLIVLN